MNRPCPFESATSQFRGTAVEQAQCLLRKVKIAGNVDDPPIQLPRILSSLVGEPTGITQEQLAAYLAFKGISAANIGGPLSGDVSTNPQGKKARYFVIHDTSDELAGNAFPPNINDATWPQNDLAERDISAAHVFINRLGQSATGHNYKVARRATKRESRIGAAARGLFLHHELIQPRIKGSFRFHAVAPQPGFTAATMDRLALCYLAASVRRGSWLIPAFHCVLDLGIDDGHDDPQNFDLFQWCGAIEKVLTEVTAPAVRPEALVAEGAAAATEAAPDIETVRSDLSDGRRNIKVRRIRNTNPLFFKAKLAIDADGAARAYHPDDIPEALDALRHATSHSRKFIQGRRRNGVIGKGPRPGFFVSATALSRGPEHDAGSYVDAEFVPYIVLPANFAAGVAKGDLCTIVNLKNFRVTPAIFADVNPNVGEASVRAAINLHVQDPAFPITELARHGGDDRDNYVYIIYPESRFTPQSTAPHWPVEEIAARADSLFAEWGGLTRVREIFS